MCSGMYKPEHIPAWKRVTDFVYHTTDAKIGIQLGHAGRKAATPVPWETDSEKNHWEIYAPSPIAFSESSPTPTEMTRKDLDRVRDAFANAARMADEAGFNIIELHGGHGYLLSSFISPLTNQRTDDYGGSLENRMRFPLEVFNAVRDAFPAEKPISARISAFAGSKAAPRKRTR